MAFPPSPDSAWLADLPKLGAPPPPAPTGFWANPVVSSIASGFGKLGQSEAEFVQAGGAALGLPGVEAAGARGAERAKANTALFARPDLEQQGMLSSPSSFIYHLGQQLPTLVAAGAGAEALPAIGGAGALARAARAGVFMLPSAVGANVEEQQAQTPGELTQEGAIKAIALGAPEALAQGFVPGSLEQILEKGAAGQWAHRALVGGASLGAYQGVQAGATRAITDAAYHPEMGFSDRAENVVKAALEGGITGAVFGGAIHAVSGQKVSVNAPTEVINDATAKVLEPTQDQGGQNLSNMQLPAPQPLLQITDQRTSPGNIGTPTERPIAVNTAGEASATPTDVMPGQTIFGGQGGASTDVAAASRAGAQKALPAPTPPVPDVVAPLAETPSEDLRTLHTALAAQDTMDTAQSGQFQEVRAELAKRTVPGLKIGEGNLFTPEEVAARAPQVAEVKASLDLPEKAQNTPWFKNLNAANEPELINAIDAELKSHDRVSKADATADNPMRKATKVPDWLQELANDKGLMDGSKPSSPAEKLEGLTEIDKPRAQAVVDAATKVGGAQLRAANRKMADINAQIEQFTALDAVHQEAARQLADAKTPKDPATGTPIAQPDLTVKARPAPTGLDPAVQAKWDAADAIVRGNNSDAIKNQALAHQAALEAGQSVTKQTLAKLGSDAKKEAKSYSGPDRSIVEDANAVQERSAAPVDAREPSGNGGGVGGGDAARAAASPRAKDLAQGKKAVEALGNKFAGEAETSKTAKGPVAQEKLAPEWAHATADARQGEVIYSHPDGEHVVVRSFDAWGEPQYQMHSHTGVIPDEKVTQALEKAITQDKLQDKFEAQKNPEGPWKGKDDSVVGTTNVPLENVGLVGDWLRQVGLGNVKVALVNPLDARGAAATREGLNGDYQAARRAGVAASDGSMNSFGPKLNDFYMHTDPTLSPEKTIDTLAHETGHIVEKTALLNASPETKRAINDAYAKYYAKANALPLQEAIKLTRLRSGTADASAMTPEKQAEFRQYVTSFSEWFADNVARELTSAREPLSVVGKFFYNVAQKVRQLLQVMTGNHLMPDEGVAKFMQDLRESARRSPDMWSNDVTRGRGGDRIPAPSAEQLKQSIAPKSPEEANRRLMASVKSLDPIWQKVAETVPTLPTALRKQALIAQSFTGIVNIAGKYLKTAPAYHDGFTNREARTGMKDKTDSVSHRGFLALKPEQQKPVNSMLAKLNANPWFLDPRKPIGDYAKVISDNPKDADAIRALHRELVGDWSRLQQASLHKVVESILSMNQTKGLQANVALMHSAVEMWAGKSGINLFGDGHINPDEAFRTQPTLHDDPTKAQLFYAAAHSRMLNAIKDHVAASNDPFLKPLMEHVQESKALIDTGIYSPLTRENYDHFVSGRLATDDAGRPKAGVQQALSDAMQKADFSLGMSYDPSSSVVMTKIKDLATMNRLHGMFTELEKSGVIEPGSSKAGHPDDPSSMGRIGTPFIQRMIEGFKSTIEKSNIDDAAKDRLQRAMVAQLMDTVSDRSTLPSMQKRNFTSGFDPEMGKAAVMRALNSSRASTAVSSRSEMARLAQAMIDETNAVKGDQTMKPSEREIGSDALREILRREAEQAWHIPHSFIDTIKSGMHTIMVGLNPAYTLTAMSQVPTLLHPELAKQFGYGKSAVAIGKATGRAFNIMRAVFNSPDGWNVGFREDALRKAGISERDIQTVMKLENAGKMTSFTQAMSELGEGSSPGRQMYKNISNAMGVYAEQLPRVIAALTAGDLYAKRPIAGKTRDEYVSEVVSNSQFNWGPGEASRLTSKRGPLGAATQISLAFMQYQTNMVQKLYTEMHAAFGKDGPQAQKEAGKFLAAHMVNVIAIAGTLGLPGAAFVAGAFDKIYQQLTGRDDMDIQGLYRTYLAHTFGADVADVIAKGLPRAAGLDLSKLGDANLIPGTGFMTDKRKWEDASKDWLKSMAGAGGSEAGNLILASRDLMNGDYMMAATKFLPEGAKGLAEGAYYSMHGYVDKDGVPLPIGSPSALDIVYATLGFDPARLAQYQEAKRISGGLEAQREFRSQNITQHLVKAQMTGDSSALGSWLNAAAEFTTEHPGMPSPLTSIGTNFTEHARQGILAKALGAPLGVGVLDPNRSATGFLSTPQ